MIDRVRTLLGQQLSIKPACLDTFNHAEFHIHDPHPKNEGQGPCCVLTTGLKAKSDLRVLNGTQRTLHFLAIDHCVYDDSNPSKCDCALVSGDTIYFIEFKTSEHHQDAKLPKANANPGDCINQLAASIRDFYDRNIIQPGQTVYAYASVGYPRHRPQHGAHYTDQLSSLQLKVQEGATRSVRLRYCSESELTIK